MPSKLSCTPSMDMRNDTHNYPHGYGSGARLLLRFFQFVLALTVCGLYGVDLQAARKAGVYIDGRWAYAEVVAGLSAVGVFVYLLHLRWLVVLDFILFLMWTALFGLFGKIYIHADPTPEQGGQIRMKRAVWIDLINMLLWFVTFCSGVFIWWMERGSGRTLHTGRADV